MPPIVLLRSTATTLYIFHKFQVSNFFTRLIQRVAPKSYQQALGEVQVTQKFLENFSGDQVCQDRSTHDHQNYYDLFLSIILQFSQILQTKAMELLCIMGLQFN